MSVAADAPADPAPPDAPKPRFEAYVDPYLGAESGARDVGAMVSGVAAGEAWLDRRADSPFVRGARFLVWDLPVGWWFGVAQHEVFGHGGRAREFDASPGFHLGSPWGGRDSYASFDGDGQSTEHLLYIYAGGTEANGLNAGLLERRAVEGVRLRPLDLVFLASSRFVASDYVLRTTPDPAHDPAGFFSEYSGGGDVANYLVLLTTLHGEPPIVTPAGAGPDVEREYGRLRRQAFWNAADPGAWWALASAFRQIARGDDSAPVPLPRIGGWHFLPALSAEWTPSGGQTSLEWIMAPAAAGTSPPRAAGSASGRVATSGRAPSWFSITARRGAGPSGAFGALGAATGEALPAGPFLLGGMAEVWHDPLHGLGGGARLRARVRKGGARGLYVDVGVKSQGYWVGQPAGAGPYLAVGFVAGS